MGTNPAIQGIVNGKVCCAGKIGGSGLHPHIRERQAAGIAAAKGKGVYTGRKKGTTKATPERAKALKEQGLRPPRLPVH